MQAQQTNHFAIQLRCQYHKPSASDDLRLVTRLQVLRLVLNKQHIPVLQNAPQKQNTEYNSQTLADF